MNLKKRAILVVLDGWGHNPDAKNNPINEAKTPFFDHLLQSCPTSTLEASGEAVGLPRNQMGNSEVGHTTIGAGSVLYTDIVKISKAAAEDKFVSNKAFLELFEHVKKYDSVLHVQGLVSPGGVHSHSEHLYAFVRAAKKAGIEKIVIHAFTDGRDTPPKSSQNYLKELESTLKEIGAGFIATTSGRFYAMDRDNNWDRLQKVEDAIFLGKGHLHHANPSEVIKTLQDQGLLDEHIEPLVFLDENGKSYTIQKNDGVFIFNFRKDRSRMLTKKTLEKKYKLNLCVVTMTEFDKSFDCLVAFPPELINTTLAKEISNAGLSQFHIAETEKFAHATFYLNGGKEDKHKGEEHILIESRRDIPTHDLAPEMRAKEITDTSLKIINDKCPNFIFINYANPDMIGHTGNKKALIRALEVIDSQLEKLVKSGQKNDYSLIITADHGNAEVIFDNATGQPHTSHTTSLVPLIYVGRDHLDIQNGTLADIAPTILELLGLPKPKDMTGKSLILN